MRFWFLVEVLAIAAITLFAITEFFYPLLTGKPLFGSFRRQATKAPSSLDDELEAARRKAEEVKDVQRKAADDLRRAAQRKDRADDLMN